MSSRAWRIPAWQQDFYGNKHSDIFTIIPSWTFHFLSLWLQFYRFQHRQSVHLLPRWDDTCLKWRTPKLGGKHVATSVGQIAMCHLRAFGRKMFDDLAMFWIVLKCFPEPDSCRHVQFAFVPRFVPGNVCLKRSTNPSLLFYLNPCMNCKDLTSCDNVYKGLTSTGALNMPQHDQRRPEALEQVERRRRISISKHYYAGENR